MKKIIALMITLSPLFANAIQVIPARGSNHNPNIYWNYEQQNLIRQQVEIQRQMFQQMQEQNSYYNRNR